MFHYSVITLFRVIEVLLLLLLLTYVAVMHIFFGADTEIPYKDTSPTPKM